MANQKISVVMLGQVGCKISTGKGNIYIDPYLSDAIERNISESLKRLRPIPISPDQVDDADLVLITHDHEDHCDLETLVPISLSSPGAKFVAPMSASKLLKSAGVNESRIVIADHRTEYRDKDNSIVINTVPSAHPSVAVDEYGYYNCVGYVVECQGKRIYHPGDTSLTQDVLDGLQKFQHIDLALLPVNERNFYRDSQGILGNMTIREAFQLADDIYAEQVIPTHWDMFEANQVFKEEIELLYRLLSPKFSMNLDPELVEI